MCAWRTLSMAMLVLAVAFALGELPDPVLQAGVGTLNPISNTSGYLADGVLQIVGLMQWADHDESGIAIEAMRTSSGVLLWRDHVNALGGVCVGGSTYAADCPKRLPVSVKLYSLPAGGWYDPAGYLAGVAGQFFSREEMVDVASPYQAFWDAVCLRPPTERPHLLFGPSPDEHVILNSVSAMVNANCTDIPTLQMDGIPLYYELAGGPRMTYCAIPPPDLVTRNLFSLYKAKGATKWALLGREGHPASIGFLGAFYAQLTGDDTFIFAPGLPTALPGPPFALQGFDANGTTVVMKRCASERTNPTAPDCETDADCPTVFPTGPDRCLPGEMSAATGTYGITDALEYLNWIDAMKRAEPDVILMAGGTEEFFGLVEAVRIQQYTPKGATQLAMNYGTLRSTEQGSPLEYWAGMGVWTRDRPGGVSGRYFGTAPEYWDAQVAADDVYASPYYLSDPNEQLQGSVGLWCAAAVATLVATQLTLEKAGLPREGKATWTDDLSTTTAEDNFARFRYELLRTAECGTARDAATGDIVGSGDACSNFPPLAASACATPGEACIPRSTFFGALDFGGFGLNVGGAPFLAQFREDAVDNSTVAAAVETADQLVYPAPWAWKIESCPAGQYLDAEQNLCISCATGFGYDAVDGDCKVCENGTYSLPIASTASATPVNRCEICPAGRTCPTAAGCSALEDAATCPELCPLGAMCPRQTMDPLPCPSTMYQDEMGSSACKHCPTGFGIAEGSDSLELCICPDGTRRANVSSSSCVACGDGQDCAWVGLNADGANVYADADAALFQSRAAQINDQSVFQTVPDILRGFWADAEEPLRVLTCDPKRVDPDCIGGNARDDANGTLLCAGERYGRLCTECLGDMQARVSGGCVACDASADTARVLGAVAILLLVVGLIQWIGMSVPLSTRLGSSASVAALGILIEFVQALAAIHQLKVQWASPLSDVLDVLDVLGLQLEVLQPSCIGLPTPTHRLLAKFLTPIALLLLFVLMNLARMEARRCCHAVNGPSQSRERDGMFNTVGTVLLAAYTTLALAAFSPFVCFDQPDGSSFSYEYKGVECTFDNRQYREIFILAILAVLIYPVGLLACAWYGTRLFPAVASTSTGPAADPRLATRLQFLFVRWRPERPHYTVQRLVRNLAIAAVPTCMDYDSPEVAIAVLSLVLSVSLAQQLLLWPWRRQPLNYLDATASVVLLQLLAVAGAGGGGSGLGAFVTGLLAAVFTCAFAFIVLQLLAQGNPKWRITSHVERLERQLERLRWDSHLGNFQHVVAHYNPSYADDDEYSVPPECPGPPDASFADAKRSNAGSSSADYMYDKTASAPTLSCSSADQVESSRTAFAGSSKTVLTAGSTGSKSQTSLSKIDVGVVSSEAASSQEGGKVEPMPAAQLEPVMQVSSLSSSLAASPLPVPAARQQEGGHQ